MLHIFIILKFCRWKSLLWKFLKVLKFLWSLYVTSLFILLLVIHFKNVTQTQFYDNAISSSIVISLMHDVSIDQNLDRNKWIKLVFHLNFEINLHLIYLQCENDRVCFGISYSGDSWMPHLSFQCLKKNLQIPLK